MRVTAIGGLASVDGFSLLLRGEVESKGLIHLPLSCFHLEKLRIAFYRLEELPTN